MNQPMPEPPSSRVRDGFARRSPAAFEVVVIRAPAGSAGGRAPSAQRSASGLLDRLKHDGRAVEVFPASWRDASKPGRATRGLAGAAGVEDFPEIVSVGVTDDRQALMTLEALQQDDAFAIVYVAPPRYVLARHSGARHRSAAAASRSHWGSDAIGVSGLAIDASGIRVAVVDSGVDRSHPDLSAAIHEYRNFTAEADQDLSGHGTHVCGILAAGGTLPGGMRGVCNAGLLVYKGLGLRYSARSYYQALREACDGEALVVNLSLGGRDHDPAEELIVARAVRAGKLVVAAMGNEFENGDPVHYPAALPGVLAVGAVDEALGHAPFSNTGDHIGLVAPGVAIWSTVPTHRTQIFSGQTAYAPCEGTSMAAPYVTGVAALMAASAGGAPDMALIRARMPLERCPGQKSRTVELGGGVVNWRGSLQLGSA